MGKVQQKIWPTLKLRNSGLLRAARYAFMPNKFGYCGPDKNQELGGYIRRGFIDDGLKENLAQFETLYPYLKFIARVNRIFDPFDERVVMAYWLGNEFLDNISPNAFYRYLEDDLRIKKKIGFKNKFSLYDKLPQGARPNHAFHVMNIFQRTGHVALPHTLATMDNCRISWGKVLEKKENSLIVETKLLVVKDNFLTLGLVIQKEIAISVDSQTVTVVAEKGDFVTFHWGSFCEKVSEQEVVYLSKYTNKAIELANLK